MIAQALVLVFVGLMAFAAWTDLTRFKIPNWLCLVVVAVFPVYGFAAGLDVSAWGSHLLGGLVGLLLGMALFAPGYIGGGDGKLFAAASLWFGWGDFLPYLLTTLLAGGALAVLLLLARKNLAPYAGMGGITSHEALQQGGPVPYGIALAAGAMWWLPKSGLLPLI